MIDQLTTRSVMEAPALYEPPPFSHIHTGGPNAIFASNKQVTDGIFEQLKTVNASIVDMTR